MKGLLFNENEENGEMNPNGSPSRKDFSSILYSYWIEEENYISHFLEVPTENYEQLTASFSDNTKKEMRNERTFTVFTSFGAN